MPLREGKVGALNLSRASTAKAPKPLDQVNIQVHHPPLLRKHLRLAVFFSLKNVAKASEVMLKQAILHTAA